MNIKLMLATTAVLGLAAPALAETPAFEDVDTDGNGAISLSEVQAVAPEVTEADFDTFDHDDDGALSETEFEVWTMAQPEPGSEYGDEAETVENPQNR
jgi:Ca2+-binding EF-hand superfamily protein